MNEVHKIISNIQAVSNILGMFSSKLIGRDEIDDINYYDDPDHVEFVICENVKGTNVIGIRDVYSTVYFHKENYWKFQCIELDFYILNDIFPAEYLNLPKVIKIPRSDGSIQDGYIKDENGVKIRKSVTYDDGYDKICIEVSLSDNQELKYLSDINDDKINSLELAKTIPLDVILQHNPEIKEINLSLFLFDEKDFIKDELTDLDDKIKVMKHYNYEFIEWFIKKVKPCIKRLEDNVNIKFINSIN